MKGRKSLSVDWGLSGAVVLTGLVLVFVILLVLIITVEFTSRIVNSATGGSKASPAKVVSVASAPKAQYAVATAAPAVQAGIEEETVAAIMAAVSCMTDQASGVGYAVRSINRAKSDRPVWGFAGMQQNTRPF